MTVLSSPGGAWFIRGRVSLIGIGCNNSNGSIHVGQQLPGRHSGARGNPESRRPSLVGAGCKPALSARPNPWMPDQVGHDE